MGVFRNGSDEQNVPSEEFPHVSAVEMAEIRETREALEKANRDPRAILRDEPRPSE